MSVLSAIHSQASASFNWLDAMSADKAYYDPRTSGLHRFPLPFRGPFYPMDDLGVTSPALVHPQPTRASTTNWVQKNLDTWETEGFEPLPVDDIETESDVNDDNESFFELKLEQLQLELMAPYPKPFAGNSLLSLHDHIHTPRKQRRSASASQTPAHQTRPVQQTELHHDPRPEEPILYHPILIDPVLEPSAYAFSGSSSSLASSTDQCTQNVGKLIANMVRKAAARGAATCRELRQRLSL